jgi:hypothetical protein
MGTFLLTAQGDIIKNAQQRNIEQRNIEQRNIATPFGRVRGCGMTPNVLREVAREAATRAGIENLVPLCLSGGELGSDSVLAWLCFHVDRDQRRSVYRSGS